jgi:hypothetical protein
VSVFDGLVKYFGIETASDEEADELGQLILELIGETVLDHAGRYLSQEEVDEWLRIAKEDTEEAVNWLEIRSPEFKEKIKEEVEKLAVEAREVAKGQ